MLDRQRLVEAGIDYDTAVKRFAGKELLYEKYLKRFDEENHYDTAMDAYINKNYDIMLSEIHTLKGIVGTLGLNDLYEACQEVIVTIRKGQLMDVGGLMDKVTKEYGNIKETLKD